MPTAPRRDHVLRAWRTVSWITNAKARSIAERTASFARRIGRTPVELAFAWLASHPVVTSVIAGATTPEQVAQNARAADKRLTSSEMHEIEDLLAAA